MNRLYRTYFTERFHLISPKSAEETVAEMEVLLSQSGGFNFSVISVQQLGSWITYVLVPRKQFVYIQRNGDRAVVTLRVAIKKDYGHETHLIVDVAPNISFGMLVVVFPMVAIAASVFANDISLGHKIVMLIMFCLLLPAIVTWLVYHTKKDFLNHFCHKLGLKAIQ